MPVLTFGWVWPQTLKVISSGPRGACSATPTGLLESHSTTVDHTTTRPRYSQYSPISTHVMVVFSMCSCSEDFTVTSQGNCVAMIHGNPPKNTGMWASRACEMESNGFICQRQQGMILINNHNNVLWKCRIFAPSSCVTLSSLQSQVTLQPRHLFLPPCQNPWSWVEWLTGSWRSDWTGPALFTSANLWMGPWPRWRIPTSRLTSRCWSTACAGLPGSPSTTMEWAYYTSVYLITITIQIKATEMKSSRKRTNWLSVFQAEGNF